MSKSSKERRIYKRTCKREGCDVKFETPNPRKLYHEPACAAKANSDSRKQPPRSLDDVVADEQARDIERANKKELRKILSGEHRMRRYETVLNDALTAYEPVELAAPTPADSSLPVHEDILVTGDWHIGQKTTLEETGGIYEQDVATARAQVAQLWRATERIHAIESSGRNITKLHHIFLGDLVEGSNMRPSQHRKIEDVVTVQMVEGFDLLAWQIRQELTIFPEVEVDLVGGNHDRGTQKAGDAGLGELSYVDTFSWLAGAFLERVLANDIETGRLKVRNWTTFFGFKEIANQRVVFEHGSSFKWSTGGYGGIPWYGVSNLGPKYNAMLGGADLILLGHGHRPAILPHGRGWIVANGALPATSTYVQAGQKVVSRPQQWRLSAHHKFGITNFTPIYADVPEALLPGMVWEAPEHYADLASGKVAPTG